MLSTLIALAVQAAAPAATPPPAVAPLDPANADARCLAAFALLADEKDRKLSEAGRMGVLFFTGKLLGHDPKVDLGKALRTGVEEITAPLQAETQRCNTEFGAMGEALVVASKQVK